jgi:general secretion pathway protein E
MNLTELLTDKYQVLPADIERAKNYQKRYGGRIDQILVNIGSLSDDKVPEVLSLSLGIPLLDYDYWQNQDVVSINTEDLTLLLENKWIPLEFNNATSDAELNLDNKCAPDLLSNNKEKGQIKNWKFACLFPLDLTVNQWLVANNINATVYIASESELASLSVRYASNEASNEDEYEGKEEDRLRELATEAPTVNLLNSLISRGLREGASDMHLEPHQGNFRARYRIDGVLKEAEVIPSRLQLPIVTRLKILSGMDIAEKRRPQDGKIEMKIANQELDIRVSCLPVNNGESVVMRFLRKESVRYDMSVIGLSPDIEEQIRQDIQSTAGVVLLTGPTGSGKTTSLYTFLNELNNDGVKIITLEDPVEYQLEGINQVQVNSDIGFDFSAGLRSIVRQDPDVIMLGEIRDKETAQIAMQSALTGHLVFSTVHTNDAASAYTRLLDLGVEEFLLNAALVSIVAQRLARKLCEHCAIPHTQSHSLIEQYNLTELALNYNIAEINLKESVGCSHCNYSGYKGRMAVIEYLGCDDAIKAMPKDSDFISKAKSHNKSINRRTLLEDGLYKAISGLTTIDEVVRVAG